MRFVTKLTELSGKSMKIIQNSPGYFYKQGIPHTRVRVV